MSNASDSGAAAQAAAQAAAIFAAEQAAVKHNFGFTFAGSFVAILLLGFVIAQMYMYYTRYPGDPTWMKVYVAYIFAIDIFHCILIVWWIYDVFVNNWGNIAPLVTANWLLAFDPFLLGLIVLSSQLFFAYKVWLITKNPWLTGSIIICGLGACATGAGVTAGFYKLEMSFAKIPQLKPTVTVWMVCAVVGDLIITASISWYLRGHKSGWKKTDKLVDKIIRNTMQNGLLTSTVAFVELLLYLVETSPNYLALSFILPRLHANSIMSSLNAREVRSSDTSNAEQSGFGSRVLRDRNAPEVMVTVEAHEMADAFKSMSDLDQKTHGV